MQVETGTPYIIYKDHCNRKSNHQNLGTIQCGSFSTEVVQYSNSNEIAVCNMASVAVNMFVNSTARTFDFYKLKETVKVITYNLDKIIDVNFYALPEAELSNHKHRSIGKFLYIFNLHIVHIILDNNFCNIIGIAIQGLANAFISMKYPFESKEAQELNVKIFETVYYAALEASCEIAKESAPYETYKGSPVSKGVSI